MLGQFFSLAADMPGMLFSLFTTGYSSNKAGETLVLAPVVVAAKFATVTAVVGGIYFVGKGGYSLYNHISKITEGPESLSIQSTNTKCN